MTDLKELQADYNEYLLWWVDNGDEPMTFEEFVAAEA